mmetsp:Transcript_41259/g.68653  ORF Transcript_41259/g.68653 Transcript_41259/m.68653 type:complete len:97 (+) Transcript_41259:126-416(+)
MCSGYNYNQLVGRIDYIRPGPSIADDRSNKKSTTKRETDEAFATLQLFADVLKRFADVLKRKSRYEKLANTTEAGIEKNSGMLGELIAMSNPLNEA